MPVGCVWRFCRRILFFKKHLNFLTYYVIIIFVSKHDDEVCRVWEATAERVALAESDLWGKRGRFASEWTGGGAFRAVVLYGDPVIGRKSVGFMPSIRVVPRAIFRLVLIFSGLGFIFCDIPQ